MRKKIVAANWKMNGTKATIKELLSEFFTILKTNSLNQISKAQLSNQSPLNIILCPPSIYLEQVSKLCAESNVALGGAFKLQLGAQNVFYEPSGAFTGEVSPLMLRDVACEYAIIGHSERRQIFQESNELIAKKVKASINNDIVPIFCIGETLEQRSKNLTFSVIKEQLTSVLEHLSKDELAKIMIAYEPVWAIGTGKSATKEEASDVHEYIRNMIAKVNDTIASNLHILYGGSVKASNAKELFAMPNIDGSLVGGASLIASEFSNICFAAEESMRA